MPFEAAHQVIAVLPNTRTLVFIGKRKKDWGFYTPQGYVPWQNYLESYDTIDKADSAVV
jgi:hypothetical protein